MTAKERVREALEFEPPDKVPYQIGFTRPAAARMAAHFGTKDFKEFVGNHIASFAPTAPGAWQEVAADMWRDEFGVLWNRSIDKDIGTPEPVLSEPTLKGYSLPDAYEPSRFAGMSEFLERNEDKFTLVNMGFSLFERAWTIRGMGNLLMDMVEHPAFVEEFLEFILEWNLVVIERALEFPIEGMRFGDDWGQQRGLIMGPVHWRRFIKPRLARMYGRVKAAGRKVIIHSCGDVDELFDELVEIGLDCFNPFQPEVMDVYGLKEEYHGRLAFWGGLSTQRLLPYGTPEEVRKETRRMLEAGRDGGLIVAPAHSVPGDVPLENMLAMLEVLTSQ
jgi:uroporphyrinogen decarboxylase